MINLEKDGLTQHMMALISNSNVSTVNRYIKSKSYIPLDLNAYRNLKYNVEVVRDVIKSLFNLKKKITKRKHAFYNFKGGTGKTSLCYQISSHAALMGFNVLVIDADPQGHLSTSCGFPSENNCLTLYDCIIGKIKVEDVIQTIFPGYDCIPSNLSLTRLEAEINNLPKREERLKIALEPFDKKYDLVFIDTNPTISILNRNVITYVDILNIVCETQPYSLNGLRLLLEDLTKFFHHMQMDSCDLNIIPNKYEDRTTSSAEAMTALREYYSDFIKPDFAVRRSEDINTSAKLSKPLAFFAKRNSNAMYDIVELLLYLIDQSTRNENI